MKKELINETYKNVALRKLRNEYLSSMNRTGDLPQYLLVDMYTFKILSRVYTWEMLPLYLFNSDGENQINMEKLYGLTTVVMNTRELKIEVI